MSRIAWRLKSGATKGTLVDNEAGAIGLRDGWNYPGMSFEPWRVVKVRILTPAESRRKAAAEALRARAEKMAERCDHFARIANGTDVRPRWFKNGAAAIAGELEKQVSEMMTEANALWPRKGAGR